MRNVTRMLVLSAVLAAAVPLSATAVERQDAPAAKSAALNLNTATLEQLETLPGVGRRTAERILEYRTKNGGFKKIEELMNVKGIGEKSFLKLKPLVAVPVKTEKAGSGD